MKSIQRRAACALFSLACAASCVDTSALRYERAPISDAGFDGAIVATCSDCVHREPDCLYQQCAADPRCVQFFDCTVGLGCYTFPVLQDRIDCGQPCFDQLGIKDFLDPAITAFLPISGCSIDQGVCASACLAP